jgi:hypothetical protein
VAYAWFPARTHISQDAPLPDLMPKAAWRTARPADTLSSIADVVFNELRSTDQIRNADQLTAEDPDTPLNSGQRFVASLPCVCFKEFIRSLLHL